MRNSLPHIPECRIFDRYILKETILPFFAGFFIFTFILLMDNIFQLFDFLIGKKIGFIKVMGVLGYSLPFIVSLTIPMAILVAMISAFGRMSGDSEIVALRSFGINPMRITFYPLIFSVIIFLSLVLFNNTVLPQSNYKLKKLFVEISKIRPTLNLHERIFNNIYSGYTLWAEKIDQSRSLLLGVQLTEELKNQPKRIIEAERATLSTFNDTLLFYMENGEIHEFSAQDPLKYRVLTFQKYSLKIPIPESKRGRVSRTEREMNIRNLLQKAKVFKDKRIRYRFLVEVNKKFSIPFAAILFVFVGAPLGIGIKRGGIGAGVTISFFLFIIYYIFLVGGEEIADRGILHPGLSIWIPNILLLIAGIVIIRKAIYGK